MKCFCWKWIKILEEDRNLAVGLHVRDSDQRSRGQEEDEALLAVRRLFIDNGLNALA